MWLIQLLFQMFRPAYMDEYENLESNLQKLYEQYMDKFRNQAYLEQLLEEYNRQEHDKSEVSVKFCHCNMFINYHNLLS